MYSIVGYYVDVVVTLFIVGYDIDVVVMFSIVGSFNAVASNSTDKKTLRTSLP